MTDPLFAPDGDIEWSLDGEGDWDATRLEVLYERNTPEGYERYQWTVILPSGLDRAALPALPPGREHFAPAPGDLYAIKGALVDLGDAAGYDDARQRPEWHFPGIYGMGMAPDTLVKISASPAETDFLAPGAARRLGEADQAAFPRLFAKFW
jgi:hypothetical protein